MADFRATFPNDQPFVSRLFSLIPDLDEVPAKELEMFTCHERITSFFSASHLNDQEITDQLVSDASKSQDYHNQITLALFYSILTSKDQTQAQRYHQWLTMTTTDGYKFLQCNIQFLLTNHFTMLLDSVKGRLFWIFSMLVKANCTGIEDVAYSYLRCIQSGNLLSENIELCTRLLLLLLEERDWLYQHTTLLCSSLYFFLRCITEHLNEPELIQLEVHFCIQVLNERFFDCLAMGRDLIRALMDVSRIHEFNEFLGKLINDPQAICPSVSNLLQILAIPPSAKILTVRLTFEMEKRLLFIMERVRLGHQKHHQSWFSEAFLAKDPEFFSSSLFPDLIRYVLCCFHPPGNLGTVPRWVVVGWLLKCVRDYHVAANCKLALFFDWFFFEPTNQEPTGNLEPALLVLTQSVSRYPRITNSLVEFLYLERETFFSPFAKFISEHIVSSFSALLESGVSFDKERLFGHLANFPDVIEMFCEVFTQVSIPPVPPVQETAELEAVGTGSFEVDEEGFVEAKSLPDANQTLQSLLDVFLFTSDSLLSENAELLKNYFLAESEPFAEYWDHICTKATTCILNEHSEVGFDISKAGELFFTFKFICKSLLEFNADYRDRLISFAQKIIPEHSFLIVALFITYDDLDLETARQELFLPEKYLNFISQLKGQNELYFYSYLHRIYNKFSFVLSGNSQFLRKQVLQDINPGFQLQIKLALAKECQPIVVFGNLEQAFAIMEESLHWESYEQIFFWNIFMHFLPTYHSADFQTFVILLESLLLTTDFNRNVEFLTALYDYFTMFPKFVIFDLTKMLVFLKHPQDNLYFDWIYLLFCRLVLVYPNEMQDIFIELLNEPEQASYDTQQQTNQILMQFLMPFAKEVNVLLVAAIKNEAFIGKLREICSFIPDFEELLEILDK